MVILFAENAAFQYRPGQLLDEERHPVRPPHNLIHDCRRQCLSAYDALYEFCRVTRVEAIERQQRYMGFAGPLQSKSGTGRHDQKHGKLADTLDREVQKLN